MFTLHYRLWPPRPGLLSGDLDLFLKEQCEWGKEDWKLYAEFLEDGGRRLVNNLERQDEKIGELRRRLSRRKKALPHFPDGLLGSPRGVTPSKKKGRRRSRFRIERVDEIIRIKEELTQKNVRVRVTDKDALAEYYHRQGKGRYHALGKRTILNDISRRRSGKL